MSSVYAIFEFKKNNRPIVFELSTEDSKTQQQRIGKVIREGIENGYPCEVSFPQGITYVSGIGLPVYWYLIAYDIIPEGKIIKTDIDYFDDLEMLWYNTLGYFLKQDHKTFKYLQKGINPPKIPLVSTKQVASNLADGVGLTALTQEYKKNLANQIMKTNICKKTDYKFCAYAGARDALMLDVLRAITKDVKYYEKLLPFISKQFDYFAEKVKEYNLEDSLELVYNNMNMFYCVEEMELSEYMWGELD